MELKTAGEELIGWFIKICYIFCA